MSENNLKPAADNLNEAIDDASDTGVQMLYANLLYKNPQQARQRIGQTNHIMLC